MCNVQDAYDEWAQTYGSDDVEQAESFDKQEEVAG